MKRRIVMFIAFVMAMVLLAGCGSGGSYKTGLAQMVSINNSKDATADANGLAQVDVVIAAVTVDQNGRIQKVTIDSIEGKVEVNGSGKIVTDKSTKIQSKVEIGDAYGMVKFSGIGRNWYEQIAELEKWMIGKTISEIRGMKTKDADGGKVPDEPDLVSKVTITVDNYIDVVEKAIKNAK